MMIYTLICIHYTHVCFVSGPISAAPFPTTDDVNVGTTFVETIVGDGGADHIPNILVTG